LPSDGESELGDFRRIPSVSQLYSVATEKVILTSQTRARGAMLHLHINEQETFYQVHRSLILTKIPRLPLIYFDLDDEEEDEHTLDESLHNVNLMIYWLYHEKLPLMVKIKRAGVFDGMTWDPIEFYMFAQKLYAFELMDCIREVLPLPGQSRAFV
jgi:hypothetical protein